MRAASLAVGLVAAPVFASLAACATQPESAPQGASPREEASSTPGAEDVDSNTFARTLVAKCANVREGEMVLVSGAPKDARLLEDVATEIRRLGAHPLVWMESDRMTRLSYLRVPERFDAQTPAWRMKLAAAADAEIVFDGQEDESLLADVPAARIAARGRAAVAVTKKLMERGVRQVYVGNDLRPTADRAKRFGMTEEALARVYRAGLDVDYDDLHAAGERLRSAFEKSGEVRVTSENGTDLRFSVRGRRAFVSDGVVSDEDELRGGAALETWLPAGEAFVSAEPGSAEGRVVVDHDTWDGREYRNLVLTFHEGRLVSMSADSGGERLEASYMAAGDGKDLFGGIDVGLNPALVAPAGSSMRSFAVAGNVTVAFGADTWLGGDDACDFSFTSSLSGTTLTVDGRPVVRGGALVR